MSSKSEFRALRESVGLTQQRLADDLGVKVLSVKRWESQNQPQQAPEDAWSILDALMKRQDIAVQEALAQVEQLAMDHGNYPYEVVLPYWSSEADYREHHYVEAGDEYWTEANATSRRISFTLRERGIKVRWVNGKDNLVPKM